METTNAEKKRIFSRLCPVRLGILILSLAVILLYFILRSNKKVMSAVCRGFVRPYHRIVGSLCALARFSVAEFLYAVLILGLLAYIVRAGVLVIRRPEKLWRLYKTVLTLLTAGFAFYAGFCLLWGIYYDAADFALENGIHTSDVSVKELNAVTLYFVRLTNEYGALVPRDENGIFSVPPKDILDGAADIYINVEEGFPSLEWPKLRPKPFFTSKILSYLNFTGFFFPFTGEANINVDSPACMIPSTVAHELAHQRGVATEDQANFVGIMASLESEDPVYCYSAALLGYIHLGNALHGADYELWKEAYYLLDENVQADLRFNSEYWDRFETKVSEASEVVYTDFLYSYGEERGMKSYGACIDLLIAYYYDQALEEK